MNSREQIIKKFNNFLDIVEKLRDPEKGCPWDREQTIPTMKNFFLEECYELMHEIEQANDVKTADELGDIMLLVTLCAQIASEEKTFDMGDILDKISHKLIERHPHVFGETHVSDSNDVVKKWDEIKRKKSHKKNISDDLKMSLPPLLWAYKVQKRLANVGFDFKNASETLVKVKEEFRELMRAVRANDSKGVEEEIGDMFFSIINYARHSGINPESSLIATINKFIDRVRYIENNSTETFGKSFEQLSMKEMDELWDKAKVKKENN